MAGAWTVERLMAWAGEYLSAKGCNDFRTDIEILVSEVIGTSRMGVYLNHDKILSEAELALFKEYLIKRRGGIPLQYIIKKAYFWQDFFCQ